MDNNYIINVFEELMSIKVIKIEKIELGLSVAEKYHIWTDIKEYLVKITPEQLNLQCYEILKMMYEQGVPVVAAIKWKICADIKSTFLIYDWIKGDTLESVLEKCTETEKKQYGSQAAELLKQFHNFDVSGYKQAKSQYGLYKRYDFCLKRYRAKFPHQKEMNYWVKKKKKLWKSSPRCSLTHQDFRPENILVSQDKLYLIDFETSCISDPYSDFVFCISMQPDTQIPYSVALINKYFDNNICSDFWEWTMFYGIMAVQKYAIWKFRVKRKMVRQQAEHLFELYDGLTNTVPSFWRNKE